MAYILANGKELTVGREDQTGLLRFVLPEDGGTLPDLLSGKFTAQKYVDEAWRNYESQTEDLRTRETLASARGGVKEVEDHPPMIEEETKPDDAFGSGDPDVPGSAIDPSTEEAPKIEAA